MKHSPPLEKALLQRMADTVQDSFGKMMREHFPNATEVQLWGSSMSFNLDNKTIVLRCAGEEKEVPIP